VHQRSGDGRRTNTAMKKKNTHSEGKEQAKIKQNQ
jgi:hypothetical protein